MNNKKIFALGLFIAGYLLFIGLSFFQIFGKSSDFGAMGQEFEDGSGGTKLDWYYHPCLYSYPNKECKLVKSDEFCGKSKNRPGLPC
jgi:hypothetical protein